MTSLPHDPDDSARSSKDGPATGRAASPRADHARTEDDPTRRQTARRVLDLLTAAVRDGDTLRWDKASPYLLRHAAEHAADAGSLDTLLDDWEFLVHGDARGILTAADGAERSTPLTIYRTSLPRHVTASAPQRRHILAVDAVRHQQPDISHRLYDAQQKDPALWRCVWSTAANISTALRASLTGHRQPLSHLAVGTADNEPFAVTAGPDGSARLFHAATGTLQHTWKGHTGGITALAVYDRHEHADIVTADASGRLRRWHARTGRLQAVIDVHDGAVTGLRTLWLAKHLWALSTGRDGTVRLTDFEDHQSRILFTTAPGALPGLIAVTGSSDDPVGLIALGSRSAEAGRVVAIELSYDRVRYELSFATNLTGLDCIEIDGSSTAVATASDGTGELWDADTGANQFTFNRHGRPGDLDVLNLFVVEHPRSEHYLAVTGGADGTVRIWDLDTVQQVHRMEGHRKAVLALDTIHDPHLALRDAIPQLEEGVLDQNDLRLLTRIAAENQRSHWREALTGVIVLSASADDTVRSWHALDGKALRTYTGHTGPVRCVEAIEPPGEDSDRLWAVSCSDDATGRVWDLADRTGHAAGASHPSRIDALATRILHDQALTITTCGDYRLRLFDARTGSLLKTRTAGNNPVHAVTLGATREGPVCATAMPDKGIVVRRADTGTVLWRRQTDAPVVALQAGGSARRPVLLTLDETGRTQMWELSTGRPRTGPLSGHEGITAIATGRIRTTPVAVTGHSTGEILLWNLALGTPRRTLCLPGVAPRVGALAFAAGPSGPRVASRHLRNGQHSIRVTDAERGLLCSVIRLPAHADGDAASMLGLGRTEDAAVVAFGGPDNVVRMWNADTGESHTELWLPDTVHALDFDDYLLTVAYGRELAAFTPSAHPPYAEATDTARGRGDQTQATVSTRRYQNKSLLQTTILGLLLEWEGHNVTMLESLLCRCIPARSVRAAIRILIRDGMILPTSKDSLGYALEPKGRVQAKPVGPVRASITGAPVMKLRGWHGRPCRLCVHRRVRVSPGGP
ncbi:WD40 repeat domain-containing protein [Streptomyces sp. NPDC055722]